MNTNILQTIFAECPMGIAHLEIIEDEQNNTADYRFLEVNKAFLNICGLNQADLIEKTVSQLFPKTEFTVNDWHMLFNRIDKSNKTVEFDYYFKKMQKWCQVHAYITSSEFLTIMLKDISNSKNKNEEQQEREEELIKTKTQTEEINANLTAILEGTTDSIWAFDLNYNILYINNVFQKEFKATFGIWLEKGSNLLNALPEELRPIWKPRYDRTLLNVQFSIVDELETAIGKLFIQVIFNPIINNGKVIGGSCFGSNITDQKQSEIELKQAQIYLAEKESQYRLIAENSTDLIYVYHLIPEPHYEYISPSCFQLTGYKPEEGYADPFAYHKFINTTEGVDRFTQFLLNPDQPTTIEEEWKKKDGTYIWVEQVINRKYDENGNLVSFQSTVRDITERKHAEELQSESESRLEFVIEGSHLGYWDWNMLNGKVFRNKIWAEMLGFTIEEIELNVKQWSDLQHPDDREAAWEAISKHLNGETSQYRMEYRMRTKDGNYKWILDQAKIVERDTNGKPVRMCGTHTDISERKRAEEALRESEERFKSLHNASFGGITIHDKGFILDCNQGLSEMTGYSTEELIGMNGLLLISEKTRNDVMNKIMTGYEKPYESIGLRKNGEEYPVRLEARNIYYKGKPVRSVEFRDITEIKRAEEELIKAKEIAEKNEEKFRKAVLTIPDAITINRLEDGIYITANNGFYKIFNYTENEVIGKSSLILNIWFDSEQRILYKSLLEKNGSIENFEARFITKTGNIIDCLVSSSIILIDGIKHTINITKDITYLKNIESQLISAKERAEESESKFREMARLMPQIIFETDTEGKLTYANRQACIMLGYHDDYPLIGLNTLDFYIPEDRLRAIENIKLKLAGQTEGNNEYTMIKKDGTLLNVLVFSTPILKDNKPSGLRGVIVDISDRKRAENLLKENEKSLRELNAQKDKFFSIIAHDLKSPFNSILGFSQLLVEQIQSKDYAGIEEYAKIMLHSSEHAFSLLSNLLEWSRAQSGKIEFNPEFFELIEFIEDIIPIFDDVAKQKSINILRKLPHNIPIYADKHMISTVLRNFINNAIKFTNQGGKIEVDVRCIHNEVVISVKDNGIGIAKNRIEI